MSLEVSEGLYCYDQPLQALVHLQPKRIAITGGYHGVHSAIDVYKISKQSDFDVIGLDDDFRSGDICWLETPLNPTGEARCVNLLLVAVEKLSSYRCLPTGIYSTMRIRPVANVKCSEPCI